ncbi:hypothetical protein EVAR_78232_1 [Eumeta japonica]|uniref:Uncharacterized protein n=1 Tax=Eumeta variegata TaxID=151549 RepID=A0A4C1T5T8_EUMVA|nr:hypothetical protein EVAR_78232_1 [Eumeta japonica]
MRSSLERFKLELDRLCHPEKNTRYMWAYGRNIHRTGIQNEGQAVVGIESEIREQKAKPSLLWTDSETGGWIDARRHKEFLLRPHGRCADSRIALCTATTMRDLDKFYEELPNTGPDDGRRHRRRAV